MIRMDHSFYNKVVFLDRDGVINQYPGDTEYVKSWKEFYFLPGVFEGIRKLNAKGFAVYVVSNQGGVAKGLYTQKALADMTKQMLAECKRHSAIINSVYYCLHTDAHDCLCRKPKTGMLARAIQDYGKTPDMSFFIGDTFVDMHTARQFGAKTVLVFSGKEKISNRENWPFQPDYMFDNLLIAAHYLCAHDA